MSEFAEIYALCYKGMGNLAKMAQFFGIPGDSHGMYQRGYGHYYGSKDALELMNCWEYTKCGHGPCNVGDCPVAKDSTVRERGCWSVMGTLCHGGVQTGFMDKLKTCMKCPYFQYTVHERDGATQLVKRALATELTPANPEAPKAN